MSDATGAERIAAERRRQIEKEGWTPEHDDEHGGGELAWAAVCYAAPSPVRRGPYAQSFDPWPWHEDWDKRVDNPTAAERIRMLEKAGALIAAEIDRLLRAAPAPTSGEEAPVSAESDASGKRRGGGR